MRPSNGPALWSSIVVCTAILLWPAFYNGYPLLFGDTGVYINDGNHLHVTWARPMFYGLFMLPLHLKTTTWPVIAAQSAIVTAMLMTTLRAFIPAANPLLLIPVTLLLAIITSLPWFVSQLMPDVFAGPLILALAALLLVPDRFGRLGKLALILLASACITMHLSLMPVSIVAIPTLLVARWGLGRIPRIADLLRGAAIPLLAIAIITLPNALFLGKLSPSPYGKIFVLVRLIADGPGRRVLDRDCPQPGWTLCGLKDELGDNSDQILWGPRTIMVRAGGQNAVVQQAGPIIAAAIRAEPGTVLLDAIRNSARQFVSFASGDELIRQSPLNDTTWSAEFPPAEQARYQASRQHRLLNPIPGWMQTLHIAVAGLSILGVAVAAVPALRRRDLIGGLYVVIPVVLVVNAVITGALSGVFDRYQSRFVWLAPFAVLLFLIERRRRASSPLP